MANGSDLMSAYPNYEPGPYHRGPLTPPNEAPLFHMAHQHPEYTLPSIPSIPHHNGPVPLAPMTIVKNEVRTLSNPASPTVMTTPSSMTEPATPQEKIDHLTKRKRGRPKNPQPPATTEAQRNATGRSKTGCITCRRRKKKCETKRVQRDE